MTKDRRIPRHIGIIMDGNGRWAESRGEPRRNGHREGMVVLKNTVESCKNLGVDYLTVYAFSTENWKRPKAEVGFLLKLLQFYIRSELNYLKENQVALRFIGSREGLGDKITDMMDMIERETSAGEEMVFSIAFNYGGRAEVTEAMQQIAQKVERGLLKAEAIDEGTISAHLYTAGMPDPDLIIRTSGEFRTSNFLLWQSAYSEYHITEVLWPDFREADLLEAIETYGKRQRRYGGVK